MTSPKEPVRDDLKSSRRPGCGRNRPGRRRGSPREVRGRADAGVPDLRSGAPPSGARSAWGSALCRPRRCGR
eukprot:9230343-Alexandrium_andersonii.AAC.1